MVPSPTLVAEPPRCAVAGGRVRSHLTPEGEPRDDAGVGRSRVAMATTGPSGNSDSFAVRGPRDLWVIAAAVPRHSPVRGVGAKYLELLWCAGARRVARPAMASSASERALHAGRSDASPRWAGHPARAGAVQAAPESAPHPVQTRSLRSLRGRAYCSLTPPGLGPLHGASGRRPSHHCVEGCRSRRTSLLEDGGSGAPPPGNLARPPGHGACGGGASVAGSLPAPGLQRRQRPRSQCSTPPPRAPYPGGRARLPGGVARPARARAGSSAPNDAPGGGTRWSSEQHPDRQGPEPGRRAESLTREDERPQERVEQDEQLIPEQLVLHQLAPGDRPGEREMSLRPA